MYVTFHKKDDILHFVKTCSKYDDAIDIKVDKLITDAKSVVGMLLMQLDKPLEIEYKCYDEVNSYEEFRSEILKKYDIRLVSAGNR